MREGKGTLMEMRFLHFTQTGKVLISADYNRTTENTIQTDTVKNTLDKTTWNSKKIDIDRVD